MDCCGARRRRTVSLGVLSVIVESRITVARGLEWWRCLLGTRLQALPRIYRDRAALPNTYECHNLKYHWGFAMTNRHLSDKHEGYGLTVKPPPKHKAPAGGCAGIGLPSGGIKNSASRWIFRKPVDLQHPGISRALLRELWFMDWWWLPRSTSASSDYSLWKHNTVF